MPEICMDKVGKVYADPGGIGRLEDENSLKLWMKMNHDVNDDQEQRYYEIKDKPVKLLIIL